MLTIREKTISLLMSYAPKIKEQTTKLVIGKLEPMITRNANELINLSSHCEQTQNQFIESLNMKRNHPELYREMDTAKDSLFEVKEKITKNENYLMSNFSHGEDSTDMKENILNAFDRNLQALEENSRIYSSLNHQTNQSSKLIELKLHINEKIRKIYEAYKFSLEVPNDEVLLLERLRISLTKIEALQEYLTDETSLIETEVSENQIHGQISSREYRTEEFPRAENRNSNMPNNNFKVKFDVQSIPSYLTAFKKFN